MTSEEQISAILDHLRAATVLIHDLSNVGVEQILREVPLDTMTVAFTNLLSAYTRAISKPVN